VLFIWFIYKSILYKLVLYIHFFKENSAYSKSVWFSYCAPAAIWRKVICRENSSFQILLLDKVVDNLIIPDCPKLPVWQRVIMNKFRYNYFSRSAHHVRPTILRCTIGRRFLFQTFGNSKLYLVNFKIYSTYITV
jgi:hypothetical protein